MGLSGISKSTVSKLKDIDDRVNAFLDRPLVGDWPYLWLDATYLKQREGGRIVPVSPGVARTWPVLHALGTTQLMAPTSNRCRVAILADPIAHDAIVCFLPRPTP